MYTDNNEDVDVNTVLLRVVKALDNMPRIGENIDVPEGVRYIQISDTLLNAIARKIEECTC